MRRGSGVRFERIELRYGRHAAAFDLTPEPRPTDNGGSGGPFVILGPNGAGKSTLLEALLRTLFGFRRLSPAERAAHDLRRPWRGGGYHGRVRIGAAAGAFTFERDFDSDLVRVTRAGREAPEFEEEANPAREGESMRRYGELLERTIGLSRLDHYLTTACVLQGGLRGTDLDQGLLRVAAGGHADIETAQTRLDEEYRRLTVDRISEDASRRRKPGELQRVEAGVGQLEARLSEARTAEGRRLPLVRSRDELRGRLKAIDADVGRLERAFETLSEAERLDMEAESSHARIRVVGTAARDLDEALARLGLLSDRAETDRDARYPVDFETRARLLDEELWPAVAAIDDELARLEAPVPRFSSPAWRGALVGLVALSVGVVVFFALGWPGTAIALGALGAIVAAVYGRSERLRLAERGRRIAELETERGRKRERIGRLLAGVPDGHALAPDTLPGHRREFERERNELELRSDAERRLRQTMDSALRALETVDEPDGDGSEPRAAVPPGGAVGDLRERARDLLRQLRERADREREDVMAPLKFRLGELARTRFDLPSDVEPTLAAVGRARRARLETSARLRAELGEVERDLALETRHGESALSIARELESMRERARGLAERAEAYRRAHALIGDAYEAFRRTDEERLVAAISGHLIDLSGGDAGPLEVEGGLESAAVRVGERALPLTSPPLSYGQLHAALLAVRIGAADFLAGLGVRIPLLIDDPFVHLDERSAAGLWRVLERIARDRQVIIATQDRLVLAHLGVAADLELSTPRAASAAGDSRGEPDDTGEQADDTGEQADVAEPLDLWSQPDL